MRRLLFSAFALTLLIGGYVVPTPARAQTSCEGLSGSALDTCLSNMIGNETGDNSNLQGDLLAAAKKTPEDVPPQTPSNLDKVLGAVMTWIASLFAWLLGIAIIALNYSVYYTVVAMGQYVNNLNAIGVTWKILRDVGNILLIFGFLVSGLMVILNTQWYGWGSKLLPKLLIAAVFLNFSLFFAEAIIDTGNFFATQFYTQINGGSPLSPSDGSLNNKGLSDKLMQQLGMQQIYGAVRDQNRAKTLFDANPIFIGFMSIILFVVTAFVFFSLAFMFIARFVMLIVLIIVAPIGFAGWAMPKLDKIAKMWWSQLVEQTLTAPVLLLLLYVALAVITDAKFLSLTGGTPNWLDIIVDPKSGISSYAAILLPFLVAMGLLLIVLMVAKNMSAAGAGWATQTAGKLSFGTTAWLGRSTIGWGSQRLNERFRRSSFARVPILGRTVGGVLEKGGKASFDVRGSTTAGAVLKKMDINAGKPEKGGYAGWEKEQIKAREEYAKTLGQRPDEKAKQEEIERIRKAAEAGAKSGILQSNQRKEREEVTKRHAENLAPLDQKYQAALEKVRQMEKERQTIGDPELLAEKDRQIAQANKELEQAKNEREGRQSAQQAEFAQMRLRHEAQIAQQQKNIEGLKTEEQKLRTAPQTEYAKGIIWGPGRIFNRNRKAAENILEEAKKSKSQRDFDSLKKLLEDKGKKEEKEEGEKKEEKKEDKH